MSLVQRFQFRLQSLLLAVTAFAALFGWIRCRIEDVRQQRQIIANLEDFGCSVSYWVPTEESDVFQQAYEPPGPEWLREILGDHFFADGLTVDIGMPLGKTIRSGSGCYTAIARYGTYDDIREISELDGLELVCIDSEVTPEVIAKLRHDLPRASIHVDQTTMLRTTAISTDARAATESQDSERPWSHETDPFSE